MAFAHCNGCDSDPADDKGMQEKLDRLQKIGVDMVHTGVCTMMGRDNPTQCPKITAILDERIHMYLARSLTFREAHTDEDEFLAVERIPIRQLYDQIMAGEIRDGKTQAAILKTWCLLQGAKDSE